MTERRFHFRSFLLGMLVSAAGTALALHDWREYAEPPWDARRCKPCAPCYEREAVIMLEGCLTALEAQNCPPCPVCRACPECAYCVQQLPAPDDVCAFLGCWAEEARSCG